MKKTICLLLSFLMLISFTACGIDKSSSISVDLSETSLDEATDEAVNSEDANEETEEDETSSKNKKASSKKQSSKMENSSKNISSSKLKNSSKNESSSKLKSSSEKKALSSNKTLTEKGNSSKKTSSKKTSSKNEVSSKNKSSSSKSTSTSTSTVKDSYPPEQDSIEIRKDNQHFFKKVGRWIVNTKQLGIGLNWTCASVEFNIDCIGELALDFERSDGSVLYLKIYVDGKLIKERTNIAASGRVVIADNLEAGVHNIKIIRSSDCECGTLALNKIWARGKLVEENFDKKDNSLYIEAIGDASLIGWGARLDDAFYADFKEKVSEKQPIARNKENQDGTVSYPYVAANTLGADAYIIAKQGAGVAATYHRTENNTVCNPRNGLLPTICQYAAASGDTKYTIDTVPDVFVIDAGAADLDSNLQKIVQDSDKLGIDTPRAIDISVAFLESLKEINPDAKIIWCYGLTRDNKKLEEYITNITTKAGGAEKGIYMLKLPRSNRGDYPSTKDHEAAATVLANKIKQVTK